MPPQKDLCGEHGKAIAILERDTASQWAAIDKLRNRLPVWGTVLISVLTFALGFTLNYTVMAARMAMLARQ